MVLHLCILLHRGAGRHPNCLQTQMNCLDRSGDMFERTSSACCVPCPLWLSTSTDGYPPNIKMRMVKHLQMQQLLFQQWSHSCAPPYSVHYYSRPSRKLSSIRSFLLQADHAPDSSGSTMITQFPRNPSELHLIPPPANNQSASVTISERIVGGTDAQTNR